MSAWMSGERRGKVSRSLWVIIAALPILAWALLAFPVSVSADSVSDAITNSMGGLNNVFTGQKGGGTSVSAFGWFNPATQIQAITETWFKPAQQMAGSLYRLLLGIEFFFFGLQIILFKDRLEELFSTLTFKVFTVGFFIWLINDAQSLFTLIIGSFNQAGQNVSGANESMLEQLYNKEIGAAILFLMSMTSALLASSVAENLTGNCTACAIGISGIATPIAYISGGMALLIFSSVLVLSFTYILLTIETFIVMCGGVFFLAFAGSRFTMSLSQGYMRYALNVGAKLYAFWLIVALLSGLIPGILHNAALDAGLTAPFGVVGAISAVAGQGIAEYKADIAAEGATQGAADTAEAGIQAGVLAPEVAAGATVLGTGAPDADGPGLGAAPGAALAASNISRGPATVAGFLASMAVMATSTPAVIAASVLAFGGLITGAFGALQVIVLNALATAVPSLVGSITSGSNLLSPSKVLEGAIKAAAEVGLGVTALSKAISAGVMSMSAPAKVADKMRRQAEDIQAANDMAAAPLTPANSTLERATEQRDLLRMTTQRRGAQMHPLQAGMVARLGQLEAAVNLPPGPGAFPPAFNPAAAAATAAAAGAAAATAAGPAPRHVIAGAAAGAAAAAAAAGGGGGTGGGGGGGGGTRDLAAMSDQERNAVAPMALVGMMENMASNMRTPPPHVQHWINSDPNRKRMWEGINNRRRADALERDKGLLGLFSLALLHDESEPGSERPKFDGPGFG